MRRSPLAPRLLLAVALALSLAKSLVGLPSLARTVFAGFLPSKKPKDE